MSDPTDRRAMLLEASADGATEAQRWRSRYAEAAEDLFAALSGPDRQALLEVLRKVDGEG
ncbi:hypothetical protein [Patulibacter minatonensis]|uniref:hypothetical protein n=1 Tax=Patulibacter minatonensis TaxID=298163 RepID=UPI000684991C|nr:hypothetical protein [Patulibacter minatonensis]